VTHPGCRDSRLGTGKLARNSALSLGFVAYIATMFLRDQCAVPRVAYLHGHSPCAAARVAPLLVGEQTGSGDTDKVGSLPAPIGIPSTFGIGSNGVILRRVERIFEYVIGRLRIHCHLHRPADSCIVAQIQGTLDEHSAGAALLLFVVGVIKKS